MVETICLLIFFCSWVDNVQFSVKFKPWQVSNSPGAYMFSMKKLREKKKHMHGDLNLLV